MTSLVIDVVGDAFGQVVTGATYQLALSILELALSPSASRDSRTDPPRRVHAFQWAYFRIESLLLSGLIATHGEYHVLSKEQERLVALGGAASKYDTAEGSTTRMKRCFLMDACDGALWRLIATAHFSGNKSCTSPRREHDRQKTVDAVRNHGGYSYHRVDRRTRVGRRAAAAAAQWALRRRLSRDAATSTVSFFFCMIQLSCIPRLS